MATLVKCDCIHCNGPIEFDQGQFEAQSPEASGITLGQTVPCPHCGQETTLFIRREESPPVFTTPKNMQSCPDCKSTISRSATSCPKCGAKIKSNSSRNALGCLALVGLFVVFCYIVGSTAVPTESSGGPVVVLSDMQQTRKQYGGLEITGIAYNRASVTLRRLYIRFSVYDSDGNKVGTASDVIASLESLETWKFKATCFDDGAAYGSLDGMTCSHGQIQVDVKP